MTHYRYVDAQKAAGFPVAAACKAAGVMRSAYYAWATGRASRASKRHHKGFRSCRRSRRGFVPSRADPILISFLNPYGQVLWYGSLGMNCFHSACVRLRPAIAHDCFCAATTSIGCSKMVCS